jgi:hypothetical protein
MISIFWIGTAWTLHRLARIVQLQGSVSIWGLPPMFSQVCCLWTFLGMILIFVISSLRKLRLFLWLLTQLPSVTAWFPSYSAQALMEFHDCLNRCPLSTKPMLILWICYGCQFLSIAREINPWYICGTLFPGNKYSARDMLNTLCQCGCCLCLQHEWMKTIHYSDKPQDSKF